MSLDQNLFTLNITPNKDDPNVVDLVDPSGVAHYRKLRAPGLLYKVEVYDPLSGSLLITATSPSATAKHKTLELCNPTIVVELKYTGTITFRWNFKWEEHEFEWKREECFLLRKPDPPVLVAITKVATGRLKTSVVQILDYNINRFDVEDRKGLEIVMLTALLTFQDSNEAHHSPKDESVPTPPTPSLLNPMKVLSWSGPTRSPSPPPPPPKPAPRTGLDRIVEMQAIRGEYNEITVEEEGSIEDYAEHCSNLLSDDAMLFVTLLSASPEQVPKVLLVVEQTKRLRHKAGLSEESELHQYVLYDTILDPAQKGPRRINLDDSDKDKGKGKATYTPPNSLTVHLSKIPMPELQPRAQVPEKSKKKDEKSEKDDKKKQRKEEKKASKDKKKVAASLSAPQISTSSHHSSSSATPSPSPSPSPSRTQPHQVHPQQPSPSPSQLNNPAIYVSRPPGPPPTPYPRPSPQPPAQSFSMPVPQRPPPPQPPMGQPGPFGPGQAMYAQYAPPGYTSQPPPPGYFNVPPPRPPQRPVTPSSMITDMFSMFNMRNF